MKPKHVQHELTLVHGFPSIDSPTLLQHLHCTGMLTGTMHGRVGDTTSLEKCTGLEGNVQTRAAGCNTSNNVVFTRNVAQLHRNSSNEHSTRVDCGCKQKKKLKYQFLMRSY